MDAPRPGTVVSSPNNSNGFVKKIRDGSLIVNPLNRRKFAEDGFFSDDSPIMRGKNAIQFML